MSLLQKGYAGMFWRILRNRGGYTDKEIEKLHETKWAHGVAETLQELLLVPGRDGEDEPVHGGVETGGLSLL